MTNQNHSCFAPDDNQCGSGVAVASRGRAHQFLLDRAERSLRPTRHSRGRVRGQRELLLLSHELQSHIFGQRACSSTNPPGNIKN